jgi:butirosin biosynthesis protein H-like/uncharacterized protein DUF4872
VTGAVEVPGYVHTPGNHCGSTALRNLLAFHGTDISEEMAFGLGAGASFFYVTLDGQSPSRFTNGRASRLEENFLQLTGTPLRLRTSSDPDAAWEMARADVEAGRPVLLLTDLYYLDHYGNSAHFPGHAVVLAGYDDELSYLSDTGFEELQTTRLEHLAKARHSPNPIFPLEGHMVDLPEGAEVGDLRAAVPAAVALAAKEMLEPSIPGGFQGLPALERLTAEIADWPTEAEDWQWCARFLFQVIERRGTGGGNFRAMYSRFLEETGYEEAALAAEASAEWSALAGTAREASDSDEPDPALWKRLGEESAAVLETERRLWERLANRS